MHEVVLNLAKKMFGITQSQQRPAYQRQLRGIEYMLASLCDDPLSLRLLLRLRQIPKIHHWDFNRPGSVNELERASATFFKCSAKDLVPPNNLRQSAIEQLHIELAPKPNHELGVIRSGAAGQLTHKPNRFLWK
jgi:hypothetical protein